MKVGELELKEGDIAMVMGRCWTLKGDGFELNLYSYNSGLWKLSLDCNVPTERKEVLCGLGMSKDEAVERFIKKSELINTVASLLNGPVQSSQQVDEHADHIVVDSDARGYYAKYMRWNSDPEFGGYQYAQQGYLRYKNRVGAVSEAKEWAQREGIQFKDVSPNMAKQPNHVPQAVLDGLLRYNRQHPDQFVVEDTDLKWDHFNGCYCFHRNGMYHGVELDGTVHT